MRDPFPGIQWRGQPSPGSDPARTPAPDRAAPPGSVTGTPGGSGNVQPLSEMAVSGRCLSPELDGQEDSFDQGPEPAYTDTGARGGTASTMAEAHRYSWQASATAPAGLDDDGTPWSRGYGGRLPTTRTGYQET